ncbi:ABC transporter ATP-binding protein [Candidatus Woesearchaeota archaeon]|nr:ABC transporter ATP-binding protein [Candidatus Woesearchaeota archaeon]
MLKVEDLEASYGYLKILHGINLEVKKNDLVAIVGPNGSGKSTTIKTIFGLVKADKGKISFKDHDITNKNPDEIVKHGISYVPQGRMVFQTMSVEENLEMGAYLIGDKEVINDRIEEVYEIFPLLREKRNQKATFLSGGQQQMLSIGRALMLKPELILLDEPSLGLAPKTMVEIFRKIKEINKQGTSVILVEQNAHMALEICNKAYVLERGRIALHDGPELSAKKLVKDLYLGH